MKLKNRVRVVLWILGVLIPVSCGTLPANESQRAVVISSSPAAVQSQADHPWPVLEQHPMEFPISLSSSPDCLVEIGTTINAAYGLAIGPGPVYAVGLGRDALLTFASAGEGQPNQFSGSVWGGQKVLWVISPAYSGPVLIRGHQIGGPGEIRFGSGNDPTLQMQIEGSGVSSGPDWRNQASLTRLRTPGCYGYQVDGLNFSEVIRFRAVEAGN